MTYGPPGDAHDLISPACLLLYMWLVPTWDSPLLFGYVERTAPRWPEPHVEKQAGEAEEVLCVAWRALVHGAFQEGKVVNLGFELRHVRCCRLCRFTNGGTG